MMVHVHLLGYLAKFSPSGQEKFDIDLNADAAVSHLLEKIQFPPHLEKMILVNGRQSNPSTTVSDGDEVFIFSPATGG
jgi:molybdopterin converting factor small subunit